MGQACLNVEEGAGWMLLWMGTLSGGFMKRLIALSILMSLVAPGYAEKPQLLGYGVKSCEEYRTTYQGWEKNQPNAVADFYRYQDWLSGFISGMSLATDMDVMRGVGVSSILRRNQIHCTENLEDDFFNATMTLLKELKKLP
jgi:hypothetical protein